MEMQSFRCAIGDEVMVSYTSDSDENAVSELTIQGLSSEGAMKVLELVEQLLTEDDGDEEEKPRPKKRRRRPTVPQAQPGLPAMQVSASSAPPGTAQSTTAVVERSSKQPPLPTPDELRGAKKGPSAPSPSVEAKPAHEPEPASKEKKEPEKSNGHANGASNVVPMVPEEKKAAAEPFVDDFEHVKAQDQADRVKEGKEEVPPELQGEKKLKDVLAYFASKGITDHKELVQVCEEWKDQLPVLSRIASSSVGIKGRVLEAAKTLGIGQAEE